MDVLVTGGAGTVGTAITDHLAEREDYSFTSIDVEEHPDPNVESVVADVREYDELRPHFDGKDAVIHLARVRLGDGGGSDDRSIGWTDTHLANLRATTGVYDAAIEADVESVVYASSNHAVGMYEVEHSPELYWPDYDLTVDHTAPPRPDSMYGVEKIHGEGLGRLAADAHDRRVYALRIGTLREPAEDHPYSTAERMVERGELERGTEEYHEAAARLKCTWHSRRDLAHMVECCLRDDSVDFDIFYGVSDNERRWFDIDHARETIGYDPQDNGEEWDGPPEDVR